MRKFYEITTARPVAMLLLFALCAVVSVVCRPLVAVNYDMNDYLPEESPSTVALEVLDREFGGGITNARVMVRNVTVPEALAYKESLRAADGVTDVVWLDDAADLTIPLAVLDPEAVERYYKGGNALFSVTVEEERCVEAVASIRERVGPDNAMSGSAVSTAAATTGTVDEVAIIGVVGVAFVLLALLLTTTSWVEPLVVLGGLGVAVLLNAGSNLLFGEVSFVTNAAGSILQLAVSLDYSVFLLHRFMECRQQNPNVKEAMIEALCKSTSSILSSGLTTVIGFLALCLMRFRIGPDLGLALAKGIAISLLTVFFFSPALILCTYKRIDRTRHRSLMPDFHGFGKLVRRVMLPMTVVFAVILVPAYLASNSNDFYYGASHLFGPETQLGADTAAIEREFGKSDTYVLLVPRGDPAREQELSQALREAPQVTGILSYVDLVGQEIPTEYLDGETLSKLMSDRYSRMVLSVDADFEGSATFAMIERIRGIAERFYPGEYYLAGEGVSTYDLMSTVTSDMLKVNLIAIGAVFLVLLVTLKSVFLPAILVLSIETAIWVNLAIPYFRSSAIFYIAYLIISSVQLGATVDYAILLTDRYREIRADKDKKEAVVQTVASVTLSILTSATVLTVVGFLLGAISTHGLLSQLGYFLCIGTICSVAAVLFVLPGLLYLLDRWVCRGPGKPKAKQNNRRFFTMIMQRWQGKAGRRAACGMLALLLAGLSAVPAWAAAAASGAPKQEIVYVNLASNGSSAEVYVVNSFELTEDRKIVDHGAYTALRNMTSSEEILFQDETVTIDAKAGKLYYEGVLGKSEIPWDFSIRYFLDGEEYPAEQLAGKSGALRIEMHVGRNANYSGPFFAHYALQASFTLDTKLCRNIVAEQATAANVGRMKQLTYTILPGKETNLTVTADVTDFEMDPVAINGVPLSMNIDVSMEDTAELDELTDGVAKLDDGARELNSGAADLRDGSSELRDGVGELADGAGELYDGAAELKSGTKELKKGAGSLRDGGIDLFLGSRDLQQGAEDLESGAKELNGGIPKLLDGAVTLDSGLKDAQAGASGLLSGAGELEAGAAEAGAGAQQLAGGLRELSSQSGALVSGAYAVFEQLAGQAEAQLNQSLGAMGLPSVTLTPENYGAVLDELLEILAGGEERPGQSMRGQAAEPSGQPDTATDADSSAEAIAPDEVPQEETDAGDVLEEQPSDAADMDAVGENAGDDLPPPPVEAAFPRSVVTPDREDASTPAVRAKDGAREERMVLSGADAYRAVAAVKQQLDDYGRFVHGLEAYTAGVRGASDGASALENGMESLAAGASSLRNGVSSLSDGLAALGAGCGALMSGIRELQAGSARLLGGSASLAEGSAELHDGIETSLDGTAALLDGANELYDGTVALGDGTLELRDGVSELLDGADTLHDGTVTLYDGTVELADGTYEFRDKTSDLDTAIKDKITAAIDDMMGGDFEPVSFVSPQNTQVEFVQFVIRADGIRKPAEPEPAAVVPERLSFWQKLLRLFGWYPDTDQPAEPAGGSADAPDGEG